MVAVDFAKDVLWIVGEDSEGCVLRRQRRGSRAAYAREVALWRNFVVVMESSATAHLWGPE